MGLPGKPDSIDGTDVERYFFDGKIKEIADLSQCGAAAFGGIDDACLMESAEFIQARSNVKR